MATGAEDRIIDDEVEVADHKWVFWMEPFDDQARQVISYLRKTISPNYYMRVRGRGRRQERGEERGLRLARSDRVVVYIFRKDEKVRDTGLPLDPEADKRAGQRAWSKGGGTLGNGLRKMKNKDSV